MTTRRRVLGATLGAGLMPGACAALASSRPPSPARPRAGGAALRRGVNLSAWLNFDRRQAYGPDDFATIKAAGFDHARICVDFAALGWRPDAPAEVPGIADLDRAIGAVGDAGLVAVLDCHGDTGLYAALDDDPAMGAALVALWRRLARRYADVAPERLAFEPLNEPQFYRAPAGRWPALQDRLLAAVRESAPTHAVLVTGRKGARPDTLDELAGSEALRDPNAIAAFHFYRPYIVTHQGATWGFADTAVPFVQGVPYPAPRLDAADLAKVAVAPGIAPEKARAALAAYAAEAWNAGRIEAAIAPVAAWGARAGVPVLCSEFGVYRRHAAPETRWNWLADVRRAMERRGLGWTVWDYADAFAVASVEGPSYTTKDGAVVPGGPGARRRFGAEARRALGLAEDDAA